MGGDDEGEEEEEAFLVRAPSLPAPAGEAAWGPRLLSSTTAAAAG